MVFDVGSDEEVVVLGGSMVTEEVCVLVDEWLVVVVVELPLGWFRGGCEVE